ncbi:hypothetical protein [Listeria valentina]|uniref:hypothetical protein n=1 Tax=Listeria valentina TaxID=2705293 RepID=UPI00142FD3CB|nr:hypothetical protein [Listeria valentina]
MKDVHYIEADFEKAEKSIGSLIGKGVWGKGAIDSLKAVSKNLEEAESDIARLDCMYPNKVDTFFDILVNK